MEFVETAKAEGIRLRSWGQGNHKTTCPRCSATRKKKTDPCLSVTVFADRNANGFQLSYHPG